MKSKKKAHGNTGNQNAAGHGRPRKSAQGRAQMQISVTVDQREAVKRNAAAAGMTISQYLLDGKV